MSLSLLVILSACGEDDPQTDKLLGDFSLDVPIAYIKRPVDGLQDPGGANPVGFSPGGNLFMRDFASPTSPEQNITGAKTAAVLNVKAAGDVSVIDVSYDGSKLVFAMHEGIPEVNGVVATWNIWIYDIANKTLTRAIPEGQFDSLANESDDINPMFLPDERIVFSSARKPDTYAILLAQAGQTINNVILEEETRANAAFNLHVMTPGDAGSIAQITFNQSHDIQPFLLPNGRIGYSRWDNANGRNHFSLHSINPDGTDMNVLYGAHSHTGAGVDARLFFRPRPAPNGRLLATFLPPAGTFQGGDLVFVDTDNFIEQNVAKLNSTSSSSSAEQSATLSNITVAAGVSRGGRYTAAFPLWDGSNRALVSWGWCEVDDGVGGTEACTDANAAQPAASPSYGLWILDLADLTVNPILLPGSNRTQIITDSVAIINRVLQGSVPINIGPQVPNTAEALAAFNRDAEGRGLLKIRSVYDTDNQLLTENAGTNLTTIMGAGADNRTIRFVRIVKPGPIPNNNVGDSNNMREFLGYQVVEPDGSVLVEVPANRPFGIELVDNLGRRLRRDTSWLQLRKGETLECNGCHASRTGQAALNAGAPTTPHTYAGTNFTGSATIFGEMGETMAEARARVSCANNAACNYQKIKGNLFYDDTVWDPTVTGTNIDISYAAFTTTPTPVTQVVSGAAINEAYAACGANWDANCRILIDYETHIQPLWEVPRTRNDGMGGTENIQCIRCHTGGVWDVNNDGLDLRPPAGQLTLTQTGGLHTNNTEMDSYIDLVQNDFVQEVNGTTLRYVPVLVPTVDPADNTIINNISGLVNLVDGITPFDDPLTENSPRDGNGNLTNDGTRDFDLVIRQNSGSRNNGPFFTKMLNGEVTLNNIALGETVSHVNMLTAEEMRLIIEWTDTGASYTNNSAP